MTSDDTPSLADVASFIRHEAGLPNSREIHEATRLDADLGITGDDGEALVRAAEQAFGVTLHVDGSVRSVFGLAPNEVLFHSEGFDSSWLFNGVRRMLFGRPPSTVVTDLTAGRLREVIVQRRQQHLERR